MYIKFAHSRRKVYQIHAPTLHILLNNRVDELPYGGLVYIPNFDLIEPELSILNENTTSDKDNALVIRKEFLEALYFWIG